MSRATLINDVRVGIIGAGNMGRALAVGFIASGALTKDRLVVSAPSDRNLKTLKEEGYVVTNSNSEVCRQSDIVIIAVKPHVVRMVLQEISEQQRQQHPLTVVSVASGVTLDTLDKALSDRSMTVIRAMCNTAVQVIQGATVFCCDFQRSDTELFQQLMSAVGFCERVPEMQMDPLCGMMGSGPAYVYLMMQALADGGVKMGVPRHLANSLATQVFLGAATYAKNTGKHPALLTEEVTSPGGTTAYGLHQLEKHGVRGAIVDAVEAATKRASDLA